VRQVDGPGVERGCLTQKTTSVGLKHRVFKWKRWYSVRKGQSLQPLLGFTASVADMQRFGVGMRSVVRVKEHLRGVKSFVEVVKEGAMNHEQNCPGGREGEDRNQQRHADEHGGNFRGGPNQCTAGRWRECQGGNTTRGDFGRNQVGADTHMNPGRGGNLNPRFRNAGGGYKRGLDDRDGQVDQRDVDLRPKVRREVDARRVGTRGLSHCFNCNRDDHSQTSCLNPPPPTTVARRIAKKGLNLRICG
jgi:hypothetical protein